MAGVRDYRELVTWQLANDVRAEVFEITSRRCFQAELGLRTQLRRAADSACANIAEGFGRYQPRDFARFLRISGASLSEVIEHLESAVVARLIARDEAARIQSLARRSRGAGTQLIRYLQSAAPR